MKHFPIKEIAINATVIQEEQAPPKKHYFYAYRYSTHGQWFSSLLYPTAQEARNAIEDPVIMYKKLCCIVL
jgi:hypothetical protein